ncbi:SAM-dependent methyltransferase [Gandjariella thermophila]|uniref:S-adenosyl methyltransferase n=1 Tax=Gandjariella thermophila TaxID=1931992 RepID=A0A4D4J6Z0_9PSEU|nr:SAM-dependent methyltransferase [Gandjariella thermophila]GDY29693.1 hypothetical protein GTS_13260 [Gandjariella thermophila]
MNEAVSVCGTIDKGRPSLARIRDYWLDGSQHVAADRRLASQFVVCAPHLPYLVRTHRHFLRRVVSYLVAAGVRQFLDLGSGLPTAGNVHEIGQSLAPDCRVVYVDNDPRVAAHARRLLSGTPGVAFLCADLRDPGAVLGAVTGEGLLDPSRPVAVLMIDVLHLVPDADDPAGLIAAYTASACPGSYLALSHTAREDPGIRAGLALFTRIYPDELPRFNFRTPAEIAGLVAGLELVPPGVVPVPLWRPEPDASADRHPERFAGYAALGRTR